MVHCVLARHRILQTFLILTVMPIHCGLPFSPICVFVSPQTNLLFWFPLIPYWRTNSIPSSIRSSQTMDSF